MGNSMSMRKDIDATCAAPSGDAPASEPKVEPAKTDALKVEPPAIESASMAHESAAPIIEAESIAPNAEAPKSKSKPASADRPAPPPNDRVVSLFTAAAKSETAPAHPGKFALLAAAVALAAAFGALVGAFGASGIAKPQAEP